ncbi:MAG TPA: prepilin-type N-terminal cleavage/methylation domain-containing protein [Sedimentisphaerales bacterium]|jgi:prepilin-type N-terminal cleavage/methylation domain-containing protein|nr:prepilin-type N-terminal cleavage/methylation domain-containing protein [Sedimentisphaerales bacterium]
MRRKGFTLVELLVVIAIIALLMGILMPALSRVRQLAFRLTCGTNLSGVGKAMLIYANDYEDELPKAGGRSSTWGPVNNYQGATRAQAFSLQADGSQGKATISSCFYLLVKYAEVTPKSFICKGDSGTSEFKLADLGLTGVELIDLWDFGTPGANGTAYKSSSYSYHLPFNNPYALTVSSEPGFAVAADRNPFINSPAGAATDFATFKPDMTGYGGTTETAKYGNALAHQQEGQNVMFLDTHVEFEKRSYCSVEDDNIYTSSRYDNAGDVLGTKPDAASSVPRARKDSFLVHDPDVFPNKGRTCFAAGTPAWIDGGLVPIAHAAVGQAVGVAGVDRMAAGRSLRIERVDAHEGVFPEAYTVILEDGEGLCVVGSHLFLLDCGRWARVENLHAGSVLQTHERPVRVLAVIRHNTPYVGTVYNLKIQDADHYFVGLAGVVVRDY